MDFHCARNFLFKTFLSQNIVFLMRTATHCFPIMWNKNTFFHKINTLTTEIQQLALSNWLSYWAIIFNQDMNIPKFNSMSFLACSLRAMTVL